MEGRGGPAPRCLPSPAHSSGHPVSRGRRGSMGRGTSGSPLLPRAPRPSAGSPPPRSGSPPRAPPCHSREAWGTQSGPDTPSTESPDYLLASRVVAVIAEAYLPRARLLEHVSWGGLCRGSWCQPTCAGEGGDGHVPCVLYWLWAVAIIVAFHIPRYVRIYQEPCSWV